MYISCSCLACDKEKYPTIQDVLRKIKELGFGAFDLDAFENWQHINPSELAAGNKAWVQQFVDTVDELGLKVSSFNCSPSKRLTDTEPVEFEQYKKEFLTLLEIAEKVNCPNITLQPGPVIQEDSLEEQLATMRNHLTELVVLKGNRDLTIGLEGHAHTPIENPNVALTLIESLWPNVGLTYDPSHFAMQEIPLQKTERLLDYTVHVHVRNASLGKMQDTMENGTVDFAWLVAALKKRGYNGALTIEYFRDFDSDFTNVLALRERLVELGVAG